VYNNYLKLLKAGSSSCYLSSRVFDEDFQLWPETAGAFKESLI